MIITVGTLLALIAMALTIVNGINGKVPLWIPVLLITIAILVSGVVVWKF
jgi:hypothetical protein